MEMNATIMKNQFRGFYLNLIGSENGIIDIKATHIKMYKCSYVEKLICNFWWFFIDDIQVNKFWFCRIKLAVQEQIDLKEN